MHGQDRAPESLPGTISLGLIGDNIRDSRSPELHRVAGLLCDLDVRYDLLVPAELNAAFDGAFEQSRHDGRRGVNITYPYKETVLSLLADQSIDVERIGSANTVVFTDDGPVGHNTDYLGFIAAFRQHFGTRSPGSVGLVGAGGVGRAIAFALARLGAHELRVFDTDRQRAERLVRAMTDAAEDTPATVQADVESALRRVDGIVNCTPVGMIGKTGSPVPTALMDGPRWAFDAVYTPVETEFLLTAKAKGINTLSGYELFFHQGVAAFELFTGRMPPLQALRLALDGTHAQRNAS